MHLTQSTLLATMLISQALNPRPIDFPTDLGKWISLEPPKKDSDRWSAANHSEYEWIVTLRDGRPHADLGDRGRRTPEPLPFEIEKGPAKDGLSGSRFSAKVSDGWIIAFNAGEFGAGLWWFSPDGTERYKIAEAWVKGFLPTQDGLLAIEGLAHLSSSRGRVIRLVRDPKGRWRAEDVVNLKHAPEVAAKGADGELIVATTDRLLKVIPAEKRIEVLVDHAFWGGLYPRSILLTPDGKIYLGMRHGVALIEKKDDTYKTSWLLPNKAFAETKPPYGFK